MEPAVVLRRKNRPDAYHVRHIGKNKGFSRMSQVTEEQIVAALKSIIEPAKQRDIVSLEMISGLVVKDGNVGFAIEVDPAVGDKMEPLRKAAEKAVYNLPGVVSVTAVLTAETSGGSGPAPMQRTELL